MNTPPTHGRIHLAIVAGVCATIGSLFGKLCSGVEITSTVLLLLKFALLVAMMTINTAGCTLFVKSLQGSGSSLPATVASSATNYFCSALIGFLVFGESTSLLWWIGTTLVLCGLLLICYAPLTKIDRATKLKQR
ncbi:transmembrane protein 42-like [Neodiprion virginianus]|uniref:transmembrane protein 42-like n=1 Tax=Neodiprion fabricii TaxID=2872261 RepID=UPI00076FD271|nr:transmembrane protein 42-like [Neodiprion fabricii]XP_046608453.1 transmembrane protein 42-like [Neodiprion virginianus]